MNILYLCDEYPPGRHGGIGTAVQLLARQMVKNGHNVVVAGFCEWGYGGEDEFIDEGVLVFRFRRIFSGSLFHKRDKLAVRVLYRLMRMTGALQWDIEHSLKKYHSFLEGLVEKYKIQVVEMPDFSEYGQSCKSYIPFPKLSVPTIVKLHSNTTFLSKEFGRPLAQHVFEMDKQLIMQADAISSVSKYTAVKTKEYFGYTREIEIIHNGIKLPVPDPSIPKDPNLVIYTGALLAFKGIYQLLKAWNIVHSISPDAVLRVYGKGDIIKAKKELSDSAVDSVVFGGHISRERLLSTLATAKIAVFPSYIESFAYGPMEAMSQNTATIYTKRVSGPELIHDGVDGLLIEPDDVQEIAEKLICLLNNNKENEAIAANGRDTIARKFSIEVIAAHNEVFYEKVIARP